MDKEELQSALSLLLILAVGFLVFACFNAFGEQMQAVALTVLTITSVVILAVTVFRALW